jgi:chemotaxis signal transduction protein
MVERGSEQPLDLSETNSTRESPSYSGVINQDDLELRNVLEATFGPGAYDSISELHLDDPNAMVEAVDPDFEVISHQLTTTRPDYEPPAARETKQKGATTAEDLGTQSNHSRSKGPTTAESTLLMFELAGMEFGVAIANVIEIRQLPSVTSIRRDPAWLLGLANLRGNVIPVISLQRLLRLSPGDAVQNGHMIVVRTANSPSPTGVIVDRVSGLGATTDLTTKQNGEEGVSGWIERDGNRVAVLDLEKILNMNAVRFESA